MGATQICLTVRHVDGFTLWPSATTNYSVASSPWRKGEGDILAGFVAAMRAAGISPCFYIILGFDIQANHSGVPGPVYLDHQVEALTELLTSYGQIDRLWWDNFAIGCCQPVTHEDLYCPGGSTTSTPSADCPGWQVLIDSVRALSPVTSIVPGPDGCLVNGESFGGTYPLYHATHLAQNSYSCTDAGKPNAGDFFAVVESDFTILEPGDNWFWSPQDPYLNATEIFAQFNAKLEQGANLILNVPPNSSGVVPDAYVAQVASFGRARNATFSDPRAALSAPVSSPCASLSVEVAVTGDFDAVLLTEDLVGGQVIGGYSVEARDGASGSWRSLKVHGATVGLRLLDSVGLQQGVTALRFNCTSDLAPVAPSDGAVLFKNSAGACMGMAANATFPCYVGGPGPFSLCPLEATSCDSPGARWTLGAFGPGTLGALALAPDATVNIDCNNCGEGTHAKVIKNGDCNCASPVTFNAAQGTLQAGACGGMCLSDGTTTGALPSCAGSEPWSPTMVHLVPCSKAMGAWSMLPAPQQPPIATLAFLGAFLQRMPE
jgi:hypothetical protein